MAHKRSLPEHSFDVLSDSKYCVCCRIKFAALSNPVMQQCSKIDILVKRAVTCLYSLTPEKARRISESHLAEVIQIDAIVGRAKGKEVGIVGRHLDAADVGFAVDDGGGRIVSHTPEPHSPIVATAHKLCGVGLQASQFWVTSTITPA